MAKPRVYVTRRLPGGALDYLAQHVDVEIWPAELPPPPEELLRRAPEFHGLLTLLTDRIDEGLVAVAPRLLVISNMATGFDNIDVEAATRRHVLVTRTPGVLSDTTAEFTLALMIAAARRVVEGDRQTRAGMWTTWGPEILLGHDLAGATLGIVGMGGIGEAVARRARALGMRIVYHSRSRKPPLERRYRMEFLEFDDLLNRADFVSLHTPLTPKTRHLIDARALRLMKPAAILVNTARGPLVDQAALYKALSEGRIAGAALDVTNPEPMPPDDPLLSLANVIVTPHIASASVATRSRMAMVAAENLVGALCGRLPKYAVNRQIARTWRNRVKDAGITGQP